MATWISRGMDKLLCEDMGLDSLSEPKDSKFVNLEEDVYRVEFHENRLRTWIYNIKENLPWKELASLECHLPHDASGVTLHDVIIHGKDIFVIFGHQAGDMWTRIPGNVIYGFIPVYNIVRDAWIVREVHGLEVPSAVKFPSGVVGWQIEDKYYVYNVSYQLWRIHSEELIYDISNVPADYPIMLRVLHLPSCEWRDLETGTDEVPFSVVRYMALRIPVSHPVENALCLLEKWDLFESYSIMRLDLNTNQWTKSRLIGDISSTLVVDNAISGHGCSYLRCHDENSETEVMVTEIYRIDPENRLERVETLGSKPEYRTRSALLAIGDRIVLLGGSGSWSMDLPERRRQEGFWFRRNDYDLRCRCGYCENAGLTPAKDVEETDFATTMAEFGNFIPINVEQEELLQPMNTVGNVPWLTNRERNYITEQFQSWQRSKDVLSSDNFYDVHVLDLKPTLQTLALTKIADAKTLDPAHFPRGLHLNLNTMYAFNAKVERMRPLTEEEREMMIRGKVEFRKEQVRALRDLGAYNGNMIRRLMDKIVESRPNLNLNDIDGAI